MSSMAGPVEQEFKNPDPIDKIKPEFLAFRPRDSKEMEIPFPDSNNPECVVAKLRENNYLATGKVVFIVHGFRNELRSPWMKEMADALRKVEKNTLIMLVGWGGGANLVPLKYKEAVANVEVVGEWLKRNMIEIHSRTSSYMYGIGHSLGAHVLGQAGRKCQADPVRSLKLNRISALDPAGPCFERKPSITLPLKSTDAEMVDCIHTDGFDENKCLHPDILLNHYGTLLPWGTIDFYPNYGISPQPGCSDINPGEIGKSHGRAIDYFTWSIANKEKFFTNKELIEKPEYEKPVKKYKTSNDAQMGYWGTDNKAKGCYYVHVNAEPP